MRLMSFRGRGRGRGGDGGRGRGGRGGRGGGSFGYRDFGPPDTVIGRINFIDRVARDLRACGGVLLGVV